MKLEGKNFIIRRVELTDAESFMKYGNNEKIAQNLTASFPSPYTLEAGQYWCRKNAHDKATHFAIDIEGEAVGGIGYELRTGYRSHVADIGYWLGEPFRGKGVMSEAVALISQHIFDTLSEVTRLEASVYSWNPGSRKVLESNWFVYEWTQVNGAKKKDSEYGDVWKFAKLRG